jgi:hypothetical protein
MSTRTTRMHCAVFAVCLLAGSLGHSQTAAPSTPGPAAPEQRVTVGIEGKLDVLLPGPELKAKPADRTAPLIVRIASTRLHGTLVQYDLRYIGLVPGAYDLRTYLLRDGAPAGDGLPPLQVEVRGLLPEQHQGSLAAHPRAGIASFVGYKWLLGGVTALWIVAAIPMFLARRRRDQIPLAPEAAPPPSLAERLRPMVELASAGKLTTDQQAQLERLLLSHWQQRLGLESLEPSEAIARLRAHPEAGALLRGLEDWLHRRPGSARVDIEAMLAPYRRAEGSVEADPVARPAAALT